MVLSLANLEDVKQFSAFVICASLDSNFKGRKRGGEVRDAAPFRKNEILLLSF